MMKWRQFGTIFVFGCSGRPPIETVKLPLIRVEALLEIVPVPITTDAKR